MKTIRIMLVDDHDLVRESWKLLLGRNPRIELLGDFNNGISAIEQFSIHKPEMVLVDINMQPMNVFDVTEKILELEPSTRVIAISVHNLPRYANRIFELGGSGYITKTSALQEIHHAIEEVADGKNYICDEVRKAMTSAELKKAGLV